MKNKDGLPPVHKEFRLKDPKLWLLVVLMIATVYVISSQWGGPSPAATTGPAAKPTPVAATKRPPGKGEKEIDPLQSRDPSLMPELEVEPKSFNEEKRNLFAYYVPPPPPPPPKPDPVCGDGMCNGQENLESCPGDCPPPPPPPVCGDKKCEGGENYQDCPSDCDPPPPPEISLKYIGYLGSKDGGSVAFLTDGKEVFMGRVDDIIANRYRVIRITEEGVELGYVNLKNGQSKMIPFHWNREELIGNNMDGERD